MHPKLNRRKQTHKKKQKKDQNIRCNSRDTLARYILHAVPWPSTEANEDNNKNATPPHQTDLRENKFYHQQQQ